MIIDMAFLPPSEAQNTALSPRLTVRAGLVARARAGDSSAFDEIYGAFAQLVHGILLARVRRDDVDDLVQDVFLSAYKNLHALRDETAVGAWLAMIARNRAAEFYRGAKFTEELLHELMGQYGDSLKAAWEGDEEDPANWFWFEGNFAAYEENKIERLGADAARPHRVTHRRLTRD